MQLDYCLLRRDEMLLRSMQSGLIPSGRLVRFKRQIKGLLCGAGPSEVGKRLTGRWRLTIPTAAGHSHRLPPLF